MVILLSGLNKIRDLIYDDIDKGQLGTTSTTPTESDTGLDNADATTLLTLDSKSKADKVIKFSYLLPSTGGSTATYREFELMRSTATLVHYDRSVFPGVSWVPNGDKDLNIIKYYYIQGL